MSPPDITEPRHPQTLYLVMWCANQSNLSISYGPWSAEAIMAQLIENTKSLGPGTLVSIEETKTQ